MRFLLPRLEELPIWPLLSTPFFVVLFIFLVWWTYRKDRVFIYKHLEHIPLSDDEAASWDAKDLSEEAGNGR